MRSVVLGMNNVQNANTTKVNDAQNLTLTYRKRIGAIPMWKKKWTNSL